ncbi:unnamed protein product, partial [Mesorhabditis belari]|uniref:Mitochondrial import inner membrane translocase subunit Tim21 n=1 Tax=Mesorhabditis belari TaxID=2138241 RepID=A0AAF3FG86_9BILA
MGCNLYHKIFTTLFLVGPTTSRRFLFGTAKILQSRKSDGQVAQKDQHRSILEEVLIKEQQKPTTFAGKTAEKAQNTFLYVIVAGSIGLLGTFAYFLFEEFFAQDSPQYIFSKALDLVRSDYRCADLFGNTIKGFGEETSRGRRRHVAHHKYEKDGNERIRVKFHLKGDLGEGTCQVEKEKKDGEWIYRFLFVETKGGHPRTTHILIDNREE